MGNNAQSYWNTVTGITDRLKILHLSGDRSMREMARVLSVEFEIHLSRNAVISKLRRLGLATGAKNKKKKKRKASPKPRVKAKPPQPPRTAPIYVSPVPPVLTGLGVTLDKLKGNNCRFPTSGDRAPYLFCGLEVKKGKLYCEAHCQLSFKPNRINHHAPSSSKSPSPFRNVRPSVRWTR